MKPFAFDPRSSNDVGCCPGHDWPRLYRFAGRYSSAASHRTDAKQNAIAKRTRRRRDKQRLQNGQ